MSCWRSSPAPRRSDAGISLKVRKLSPPSSRKLFAVTRYGSAGSSGTPLSLTLLTVMLVQSTSRRAVRAAWCSDDRLLEVVREAVRHAHVEERPADADRLALLLEDRDDLRARHRDRGHEVAERQDVERLLVGDDPVALALRLRVQEVRPDSAGVDEPDLGAVRRLGRPQLGVRDHVAGGRLDGAAPRCR